MTPRPPKDPLSAQGIVLAIQTMAEMADGCVTWEQQLNWAVAVGFIRPAGPGQVNLTSGGAAAVYAFWKTVEEGRALRPGARPKEDE